jgi:hypothetical protein
MPTDPDQDDRVDIDLTDELPVLIETAVFESDKHLIALPEDEGAEHTARVMALASEEAESIEVLKKDLDQRAAKIEALERDIARLSERWLEIERHLNEKDTAISSLTSALEAAQSTIKEHRGVDDGLMAEIADRDHRIARLLDKTDLLRKQAAESRTEVERLRQEREVERREVATLRAELKRRAPGDDGVPAEAALREQLDTLTTYIANRRAWWDAVESRATAQAARIAELEREVARHANEPRAESTDARADLEAAHKQVADTRAQLEQARADTARLERALVEKDRALAARDERIGTLQLELQQRPGALEKPSAPEASRPAHDSKTVLRADVAPESARTPALICLTSEGPRPFALAKGTITIGRSSECDIQILTHFVSREHARLTVSPRGGVLIEDLGSTNGVFVNSVRVDRRELHHGDVVTVGESQFRFLETMAH